MRNEKDDLDSIISMKYARDIKDNLKTFTQPSDIFREIVS